jgi:hypothetical protein
MGQGKEAATVRQVILIVVLVVASFLGGVFVNGPSLQWAQACLLRSLDLTNGSDIASVDLKTSASTKTAADRSDSPKTAVEKVGNLLMATSSAPAEDESSEHNTSDQHPSTQPSTLKHLGEAKLPELEPQPLAASPSVLARHPPATRKPPVGVSARIDSYVTAVGAESSLLSAPADPQVAPAIADSLAASVPPTPSLSVFPRPFLPRSSSLPTLIGNSGDEWTVLERKMQTLGVSRFMVEAEPGGRAVFSCLIPLAGRQAVAQRFEADGDDIIQAARATLRRIGLWRASQVSSK